MDEISDAGQRDKRDGLELLDNGYATNPDGPWNVGSGSQELNGTYDMMGNDLGMDGKPVWPAATITPVRCVVLRGGDWLFGSDLTSSSRSRLWPGDRRQQLWVPRGKCS